MAVVLGWATPALGFHEVDSFARTANSGGGAGYYYTGSPRSKGYDCNICHVNAAGRISVELGSELTSGVYQPGLVYSIDVKLLGEHRGLMSAFNPNTFTAEILGTDGQPVGSLTAPLAGVVEIVDDGHVAVAEGFGRGETEWRFSWAAPPDSVPATLYLAMLDGDGATDPIIRFIDPIDDDVALVRLHLCPMGQTCPPPSPPEEEKSPAGCHAANGVGSAWPLGLLLVLMWGWRRRPLAG
jgi:uncharacterized protein (TIGR03382 family)